MYDVIVIGAGPAGMMASITAASNNKKVLLIEKNNIVGKKLLITGGTRCNLTNLKSINNFIKEIPANPKALYSTLNNFGPEDIYNYFKNLNISLKVEDNDRVFPKSNKSKTIVDALYKELIKNNVTVHLNETVTKIDSKKVITNKNTYQTQNIIVATGGCSYPNTGSAGDSYKFAKELNQDVTKLYPAETFLITKERLPLQGITLNDIIVTFDKKEERGPVLFTSKGLSGPAIFRISEYVYKKLNDKKETNITLDLIPKYNLEELKEQFKNYNPKKEINSFVRKYLPKRLADFIVKQIMTNKKVRSVSKENQIKLLTNLKKYQIAIKSTGTIEQSFVTGGGIDIKNINTKTMESKTNESIYFVGEALDIHGHTGGYNITIALSTGYTAGNSISN